MDACHRRLEAISYFSLNLLLTGCFEWFFSFPLWSFCFPPICHIVNRVAYCLFRWIQGRRPSHISNWPSLLYFFFLMLYVSELMMYFNCSRLLCQWTSYQYDVCDPLSVKPFYLLYYYWPPRSSRNFIAETRRDLIMRFLHETSRLSYRKNP